MLFSILLASCAPAAPVAPVAPVEVTRLVEAAPVIQEVVVTATPEVMVEKPFRVAIVMPSTITDAAFSQSMYEGLLVVQSEMGKDKMEIAYSESLFKVPDAAAALRDYATQGFDLVIAHGSQYGTSLQQIAPEFPETSFAWGTSLNTFQADGINNVFAYQAEAQQGGYVLGVLAAMISKSGKMGICGPVEAGDAKLYVDGFKAGATATKPEVVNQVNYTGSFSDVSLMATVPKPKLLLVQIFSPVHHNQLLVPSVSPRITMYFGLVHSGIRPVWHPKQLPPARSSTGPGSLKIWSPAVKLVYLVEKPIPLHSRMQAYGSNIMMQLPSLMMLKPQLRQPLMASWVEPSTLSRDRSYRSKSF